MERDTEPGRRFPRERIGLWAGLALFVALLGLPAPDGLSPAAWRAAAVGVLMAAWWMTEAAPIAATSLLPLVLFPVLGVADVSAAAAPYANPQESARQNPNAALRAPWGHLRGAATQAMPKHRRGAGTT